jgi:hypothetical protein
VRDETESADFPEQLPLRGQQRLDLSDAVTGILGIGIRPVAIRFKMLIHRGKMPLPLLAKECWLKMHNGC